MKKYINPHVLLAIFREKSAAFGDRQKDIYLWVSGIVKECPLANNVMHLSYMPGQSIWTPDGRHGVVETLYLGRRGIQRVFCRMDDGEKLNCSAKGLNWDILKYNPLQGEISRSAPVSEE
jgi:hypothetical protein